MRPFPLEKCAQSLARRPPRKCCGVRPAAPSVLWRISPLGRRSPFVGCATVRFSRSARRTPVCARCSPPPQTPHRKRLPARCGALRLRSVLAAALAVASSAAPHPRPSAHSDSHPKKNRGRYAPCGHPGKIGVATLPAVTQEKSGSLRSLRLSLFAVSFARMSGAAPSACGVNRTHAPGAAPAMRNLTVYRNKPKSFFSFLSWAG